LLSFIATAFLTTRNFNLHISLLLNACLILFAFCFLFKLKFFGICCFSVTFTFRFFWKFKYFKADFNNIRYDASGNTKGTVEVELPQPTRLKWELPQEAVESIEYASHCALALLNDVDLKLIMFNHYGKGMVKTCRVSPDAFIQMALQLAYYRVSSFNI